MQDWQIDLLKMGVTAVIAGIGGWWGHWAKNRERQKEAALREQQRQAEYDEFKKKRRLVGAGEVEKLERADRYIDLLANYGSTRSAGKNSTSSGSN
jgi:hypothetical protein